MNRLVSVIRFRQRQRRMFAEFFPEKNQPLPGNHSGNRGLRRTIKNTHCHGRFLKTTAAGAILNIAKEACGYR